MSVTTDTPRVYIACLASYNAGRLVGKWVDATDIDYLNEGVKEVGAAAVKAAKEAGEWPVYFGEPEEFAIHDYDNFPGSIVTQLGEYPSWERVVAIANLIEEQGDQARAWLEFVDSISDVEPDEMEDRCMEQCRGQAESEEDYAHDYVMECGWGGLQSHWPAPSRFGGYDHDKTVNIFEELSSYLDWESIARELFRHGTFTFVNGYIFDSEA